MGPLLTLATLAGLVARIIPRALRRASRRPLRPAPVSPASSSASTPAPAVSPIVSPVEAPAVEAPVVTAGWMALSEGSPLGALARATPLDCCVLVALWARQVAGIGEVWPDDYERTRDAAYAADSEWWARANVWSRDLRWSAPVAVAELLGAEPDSTWAASTGASMRGPTLDRWHVIQAWRRSGSGHTYLVYVDLFGSCTRVESDRTYGYRVTRVTWGERERGVEVMVAVMPAAV